MTYIAPAVTSANNPGLMAALGRANALMAAQPISTVQTFANPNPVSTAWDWRTGSFQPVEQQAQLPNEMPLQSGPAQAGAPWWGQSSQVALPAGAETALQAQPAQQAQLPNDPLRFAPPPGNTEPTHSQTSWWGAAPAAGLGSMTQPGATSSQQATSAQSQQNTGLSGWGGHKWWSAQPTAGGALST